MASSLPRSSDPPVPLRAPPEKGAAPLSFRCATSARAAASMRAQLRNLLARVLVERDRGFIHDISRAVRVFQGVEGLVKVRVGGEIQATMTVREFPPRESCSRRVSFESRYGNVPARVPTFVVSERTDHIPECEQPLINLNALLQSLSLRLGALGAL